MTLFVFDSSSQMWWCISCINLTGKKGCPDNRWNIISGCVCENVSEEIGTWLSRLSKAPSSVWMGIIQPTEGVNWAETEEERLIHSLCLTETPISSCSQTLCSQFKPWLHHQQQDPQVFKHRLNDATRFLVQLADRHRGPSQPHTGDNSYTLDR